MQSPRVSQRRPTGKRFIRERKSSATMASTGKTVTGKFVAVVDKWEMFGGEGTGWFINKNAIQAKRRGQLWRNIPDGEECNIKIQRSRKAVPEFKLDSKDPKPADKHGNVLVLPNGTLIIHQNGAAVNVNVHDTTSSDVDVDTRCP